MIVGKKDRDKKEREGKKKGKLEEIKKTKKEKCLAGFEPGSFHPQFKFSK